MSGRNEVLDHMAAALAPDDEFEGLLVDLQAQVLGQLVRVDGLWGVVSHVAVVDGCDGRVAAVVLDEDIERVVIISEDELGHVELDLGGEAIELYVGQRNRCIVFEVVPV
jgi:hypothetical protein